MENPKILISCCSSKYTCCGVCPLVGELIVENWRLSNRHERHCLLGWGQKCPITKQFNDALNFLLAEVISGVVLLDDVGEHRMFSTNPSYTGQKCSPVFRYLCQLVIKYQCPKGSFVSSCSTHKRNMVVNAFL